jgi:mono/diheme cytochrome c family protein
VAGEVLVVVAVLAVTGVLTGLPPASSEGLEGRAYAETARAGPYVIGLEVTPNQAGTNQITVRVQGANAETFPDIERVDVVMNHLEMDMGTRESPAQRLPDGRYQVNGSQLSMTGSWQIDVRVRRGGRDETARFTPLVGPPPGANRPAFSPARVVLLAVTDPSRERTFAINPRFLATLVFAAGAALLLIRSLSGRRQRRVAMGGAAALLAVTLVLGGTTVADAYRRSLPNPVPADTASLTRGQVVYEANCTLCHGEEGRGDGPAGLALRPRPADFRVHMAAGHTDAELFNWVANGVDGTQMPGFKDELSEQERWDVINYIRAFAAPAPQR